MGKNINISIVLYNSDFEEIYNLIYLLNSIECVCQIFLIDNSPLKNDRFDTLGAKYLFLGVNNGYGSGHNFAINYSIKSDVKYHLVLNSDISFDKTVLPILLQRIEEDSNIGMIMPKVLNLDGSVQFLPKLLPTPLNLLIRVVNPLQKLLNSKNKEYTLENFHKQEVNVPILSGCFSLFRVDALKDIGLYDERFFMYFEDFDISRRIHSKYKTIYYPAVSIIHAHERGAAKNFKLFKVFLKSAIIYFNKYGWFIDNERTKINRNVLKSLK
ncbi:MAG TPA: glycosyltransferase [Candidatus Paceibacterota bacterium]